MGQFELKLLSQEWIDNDPENTIDLCSHGKIYLKMDGQEILTEKDDEWTVSTSALSLLRSVFSDHSKRNIDPMIHHCGTLLMTGCPISVNWIVKHKDEKVILKSISKCPTINPKDTIYYFEKEHEIEIDTKEYAREILGFSNSVYEFFVRNKLRRIEDKYEKVKFDSFMSEFSQLLEDIEKLLKNYRKGS